jgi:hypothetical protein
VQQNERYDDAWKDTRAESLFELKAAKDNIYLPPIPLLIQIVRVCKDQRHRQGGQDPGKIICDTHHQSSRVEPESCAQMA